MKIKIKKTFIIFLLIFFIIKNYNSISDNSINLNNNNKRKFNFNISGEYSLSTGSDVITSTTLLGMGIGAYTGAVIGGIGLPPFLFVYLPYKAFMFFYNKYIDKRKNLLKKNVKKDPLNKGIEKSEIKK